MAAKDKDSDNPSLVSTAPAPNASRSGAQSPLVVDTIRDTMQSRALYWCGTLLMEGEFDFPMPASLEEIYSGTVPDDGDGSFSKFVKTTAWKCWYPGPGRPSLWAARNRYYQQLDVTGLSFPAFTEEGGRDASNEDISHKVAWPGMVFEMNEAQLKKVLESVQNHALRPVGLAWHSFPGANIVNYKHSHMPGCPGGRLLTEPFCKRCEELEKAIPESNERARPQRNSPPEHRVYGDLPFSDFVYLMKLSAPIDTPRQSYSSLVPTLPDFIRKQPPALSQDLSKASAEKVA